MYSRPEELCFLCIIQTQQNVRIFSYLTHKVLHVDVEVETRHFLWRSMKFQHLLTRSTHKCLAWSKSSMVTTRSPNSKTEGHLLQQDKKVTIQIFGFSTRQFLDRTLKKKQNLEKTVAQETCMSDRLSGATYFLYKFYAPNRTQLHT